MYRGEDVDLAFSPLGFCFFYCPREGPEHQAARLVVDMVACVSQPLPSKLADAGVKGPEGLMVSHVKGRKRSSYAPQLCLCCAALCLEECSSVIV